MDRPGRWRIGTPRSRPRDLGGVVIGLGGPLRAGSARGRRTRCLRASGTFCRLRLIGRCGARDRRLVENRSSGRGSRRCGFRCRCQCRCQCRCRTRSQPRGRELGRVEQDLAEDRSRLEKPWSERGALERHRIDIDGRRRGRGCFGLGPAAPEMEQPIDRGGHWSRLVAAARPVCGDNDGIGWYVRHQAVSLGSSASSASASAARAIRL